MAYPAAMDTHPTFPSDLWAQTPPEVRAYIGTLEARVVALEAMVQAFQEQLQQDSRNSSRPPSIDAPASQRPKRRRGQRRRGGRPGHPGHTRTLISVEDVDEVGPLKPDRCRGCQAP